MEFSESEVSLITQGEYQKPFSIYLGFQVFFPILGGFLFGYDTGVISGAILLIRKYFNLSTLMQEVVVSATILACALSSLVSGIVSENIGRRKALLISSVTLILGSILMGLAPSVIFLILGRIVVGVGVGIAATCCPIYISEVAPERIRGRLVLLYNFSITGGQLVASIVDALFFQIGNEGWRFMLAVAVIPAFIQMVGLFFIPESHRWLISKKRISDARKVIKKENRVRDEDIEAYIDIIVKSYNDTEQAIKRQLNSDRSLLCQIFHDDVARHTLLLGCVLQMFQQLVGINTVMYYSASVIRMSGVQDIQTILWLAALVALFNVLPSFVGYFLIDKIGRRKLILISLVGVFLSLCLLASTFLVLAIQSPEVQFRDPGVGSRDDITCSFKHNCDSCISSQSCGFCYLSSPANPGVIVNSSCLASHNRYSDSSEHGWCSSVQNSTNLLRSHWLHDYCLSKYSWLIILSMIFYLTFFSMGMGPVPWAITSEIYPLWCRGSNMAMSTSTNWVFNLIVSFTFLTLTEWITKYGTFWIFSGFAFCGIIFIYKFIPETNQKTLEEITTLIEKH